MKIESKNNASVKIPLSDNDIDRICSLVASGEEKNEIDSLSLSILFVDSKEIRALNKQYRAIDRATDILSFPAREGKELPFPTLFLGDLVIAPEVVNRHAQSYGVTPEFEYTFVLIHGMLHLFGYDHISAGDRQKMREKESYYLTQLGFNEVR